MAAGTDDTHLGAMQVDAPHASHNVTRMQPLALGQDYVMLDAAEHEVHAFTRSASRDVTMGTIPEVRPVSQGDTTHSPTRHDKEVDRDRADTPPMDGIGEATPRETGARKILVHPARQLESELWAARLGFCGEHQLESLPGHVTGIPDRFHCLPFRYVPHKEWARIRKQAAG